MSRRWNGRILASVMGTVGLLIGGFDLTEANAALATNNWIASTTAKWETAADWSLGTTPFATQSAATITNGFTSGDTSKTNIYDSVTIGVAPSVVSNLLLSGSSDGVGGQPNIGTNILLVANASSSPGLDILSSLILSNGGLLLITNSFVYVGGSGSSQFFNDGGVVIETAASRLVTTSATARVGSTGVGNVVLSNGFWWARDITVGTLAGSHGILKLPGGSIQSSAQSVALALEVGQNAGSTGEVWITGGLADVDAKNVIGDNGVGSLTLSNGGGWAAEATMVGNTGVGTLTIAGGSGGATGIDPAIGLDIGVNAGSTGTVWVTGGQLGVDQFSGVSNAFTLGDSGVGIMTVSNGTVTLGGVSGEPGNGYIGNSAGGQGTLTVAGGTVTFVASLVSVGRAAGSTGAVWVTGGRLVLTNNSNNSMSIGGIGIGQMTVSNGTWVARLVRVGSSNVGTLTIAGGTNTLISSLVVGSAGPGTVWVTGGLLTVTNNPSVNSVGVSTGFMTVSNGTVRMSNVGVGTSFGGSGTMALAGGNTSISSNLTLGTVNCSGTGTLTVSGGNLFVTNAAGNAVLDVESGTFTLNSGTVIVDKFVMTNSCAHFVRTGGTLIYSTAVLNPNQSAVNDGIPNGWKQQYGLDPFDPNVANEDADGTGMNNLQKYLAGFAPNNSAAYPHVISLAKTNTADIKVIYLGANGDSTYAPGIASRTNVLEYTSGTADGSYTNNFASTGQTNILGGGTGLGVVTNMIDSGGATHGPSRYYRVRVLVP